jgi:hypothetical protein
MILLAATQRKIEARKIEIAREIEMGRETESGGESG